ncbi:hypothetical protein PAPYR_12161 [Paratrimastix pyriformis]|uniref:Uncharacterized protein n=1 Tax=Paratrimastix pyriformis TaxID=342808 RepID=A0ABQ8U4P4_9EUKA|nr:hypothetical protein PAPYR_12161 [Paratrimastix pyriformis]
MASANMFILLQLVNWLKIYCATVVADKVAPTGATLSVPAAISCNSITSGAVTCTGTLKTAINDAQILGTDSSGNVVSGAFPLALTANSITTSDDNGKVRKSTKKFLYRVVWYSWYPPLVLFWYSPWYFSGTRPGTFLVLFIVLAKKVPSWFWYGLWYFLVLLRILVKYQGILVKYRLGEGEHRVHFGTLPKFGTPLVHFGTLWYTLVPVWYFFGTFLVLFWYLWYSPPLLLLDVIH